LRSKAGQTFGVRALADWASSAAPAPSVPNDCCLVLAFPRMVHPIEASSGWTYALHETGGIWQERRRIARAMAHSNCTAEFSLFDQLIEYRQLLNRFELDCNHHVQALLEGFYPVDIAEEHLTTLEVNDPPAEALAHIGSEQLCFALVAPNSSEW